MIRPLWLFGYGSIIWKTGFDYERAELGFIRDRARRFWQGSSDHRGTPDAPGRVVTLVDMPGESCWGMAFLIPAKQIAATMVELDYREKNGYVREAVMIETRSGECLEGITYHADVTNPHFLGDARLEEIAAQIHRSVPTKNLETASRQLSPSTSHSYPRYASLDLGPPLSPLLSPRKTLKALYTFDI